MVVAGVRTPFVKAFGEFLKLDTIELSDLAVQVAARERTELSHDEIDSIVWGGVILPSLAPNVAREIALDLRLPASVEGMTCYPRLRDRTSSGDASQLPRSSAGKPTS